ncbi:putative DNA polymerase epsilon catalytic subunit A [Hibiscus syriacus]|uniref:pectinesterase n=1 Tax=Hibiscus syriacus TaxID=106335 RepID=A0A6A3B4N7_HIBSY|nr:putative DNA polymerase epsilon catalytic subunit A [Hibiscus syriacus]
MAPSYSTYVCIFVSILFTFMLESSHANAAVVTSTATLVTVDQSGKGYYEKIQDAINAVPSDNKEVVFIMVKPGIYKEKIIVPADKPFITISGSKENGTIITWNNSGEIFESPTFTVLASDFVGRYLTIQNTFGPGAKAVALRISGDRAAFFGRRCSYNSPTKAVSSENTGFTFLGCNITGVKSAVLGRPWGAYSRVFFSLTYMSNVILPQGWDDWGDSPKESTVFYREYKCYGPGANAGKRVEWSGKLMDNEAELLLTKKMIGGKSWIRLRATSVEDFRQSELGFQKMVRDRDFDRDIAISPTSELPATAAIASATAAITIYCCDMPYPDLSFSEVIVRQVNSSIADDVLGFGKFKTKDDSIPIVRELLKLQNLGPEKPRCCPSSLANVMKRCWDANTETAVDGRSGVDVGGH